MSAILIGNQKFTEIKKHTCILVYIIGVRTQQLLYIYIYIYIYIIIVVFYFEGD